MAGSGQIIAEMIPQTNTDRIISTLLDLKDIAASYVTEYQRIRLLHKRNLQVEANLKVSILAFAREIKPKMMTLINVRRLTGNQIKFINTAINNITYYDAKFKSLDVSKACRLFENLREIADILGLFGVIKYPTGSTFDKSSDLMSTGFNG